MHNVTDADFLKAVALLAKAKRRLVEPWAVGVILQRCSVLNKENQELNVALSFDRLELKQLKEKQVFISKTIEGNETKVKPMKDKDEG